MSIDTSDIFLKIQKISGDYHAYYSYDESIWHYIGHEKIQYSNTKIGISVHSYYGTSMTFDFDFTRINSLELLSQSYPSSGYVLSTPITKPASNNWNQLSITKTQPSGTYINVTVLNATTDLPIQGFEDLTGTTIDLSSIPDGSIQLLAEFEGDGTQTPSLDEWSVSWTPLVPEPDLALTESSITYDKPSPNEGETVRITATVKNNGGQDADATIRFYDGHPTSGGTQIGSDMPIQVLSGGTDHSFVDWNATAGVHSIYVEVSDTAPTELNVANNLAYRPLVVNQIPAITGSIPDVSFPEDTSKGDAIDLSTIFSDDDDLIYTARNNVNVQPTIAAGKVSLSATPNWSGTENVIFRATDLNGYYVEVPAMINVTPVNDAPILKTFPTFTGIFEDIAYQIDLAHNVLDSDNDVDELMLVTGNEYAEVSDLNLTLTYPNGVTEDTLELNISDGTLQNSYSFELVIEAVNDPPQWKTFPKLSNVKPDIPYNFDLGNYITDVDNGTDDLTITEDSPNAAVIGTNMTLIYSPGAEKETINVTVSDGEYAVSQYLQVNILPDYPPVIVGLGDLLGLSPDVPYAMDLRDHVSDPEKDFEDLTITENSDYASITMPYLVIELPDGVPSATIKLTVSDGTTAVSKSFTVSADDVNDPPVIKGLPAEVSVIADEPQELDLSPFISDVDTSRDNLAISTTSDHITVNKLVLTLSYPKDVESETVTISVSDGEYTARGDMLVKVTFIAQPPAFSDDFGDIEGISPDVPYELDMSVMVKDPDTPDTGLSLMVDSAYASVNGMLVTFLYPEGIEEENVTFTVSDGTNEISTTIRVTIDLLNDPPQILPLPDQEGKESVAWTLNLRPYIVDVDTPWSNLSIVVKGAGATLEGATVLFLYGEDGNYTVTVTVSDGEFQISRNISVSVIKQNFPPVVQLLSPEDGETFFLGETVRCLGSGSDADGEIVSLTWFADGIEVGVGDDININDLEVGQHEITLEVADDYGDRATASVTVTVQENEEDDDDDSDDQGDDDQGETDDTGVMASFSTNPVMIPAVIAITVLVASGLFVGGTEVGTYGFFSMWTRRKKDYLDNKTRGMILGYVVANPGDHYSSIKRKLKLQNGTLAYHLYVLEKEDEIRSKNQGVYKRFYPFNMKVPVSEYDHLTEVQQKVLKYVRKHPGSTQNEIISKTGLKQPNVSSNMRTLIDKGMVAPEKVKNVKHYYPVTVEERVDKNICPTCGERFETQKPPKYCLSCGQSMADLINKNRPGPSKSKIRARPSKPRNERNDFVEYRDN